MLDERRAAEYHLAVARARQLAEAIPEAQGLLRDGRPVRDPQEGLVAQLSAAAEGYATQAASYGEGNRPHAERAMLMLKEFQGAKQRMLELYFDAQHDSPELAAFMFEDLQKLPAVANDTHFDSGMDALREAA